MGINNFNSSEITEEISVKIEKGNGNDSYNIPNNLKFLTHEIQKQKSILSDEEKAKKLSEALKTGNLGMLSVELGINNNIESDLEDISQTIYEPKEYEEYIRKLNEKYNLKEIFPDLVGKDKDYIINEIPLSFNMSFAGESGVEGKFAQIFIDSINKGYWTNEILSGDIDIRTIESIAEEGVTMGNRHYSTGIDGNYIGFNIIENSEIEKKYLKYKKFNDKYQDEKDNLSKKDIKEAKKKLGIKGKIINKIFYERGDYTSYVPLLVNALELKGIISKEENEDILNNLNEFKKEFKKLSFDEKNSFNTKAMFNMIKENQLNLFLKEEGIKFFLARMGYNFENS